MRRLIGIAVVALATAGNAQSVYEFLRVETSPRAAALGGGNASANEDADAVFHNPAGLHKLEGTPVSFSYMSHLMDVNFFGASGSMEFDGVGRVGAGAKYVDYGDFTETDEFGNDLGEYGAGELALQAGYALEIEENFTAGVGAKFIYSSIADYSSSGAAFDLGLQYDFPIYAATVGVAVRNLGGQLTTYGDVSESLPTDVSVGVSKTLEHLPLTLYAGVNRVNESKDEILERFEAFAIGGEFRLGESFRLRIGYDNKRRKDLEIGGFAGLAGFNAGFGFDVREYQIGYAYSSLGDVGAFHRFGVSADL
jgi:hypothetical protein